jgi:acetyl-CoA C-acetyltransferase
MNQPTAANAYLVDGVRTPFGRAGSALAGTHPAELAATTIMELLRRTGVDPARVDDVMLGCVNQIGPKPAVSPAPPG